MNRIRYIRNEATLELSHPVCIDCERCLGVCQHQVFRIAKRKAGIVDCDACNQNCPVAALKVDAGAGCATGLINEWLRERNSTGASGGCCS